MDGFSVLSLTSLTSSITHRLQAGQEEIWELLQASEARDSGPEARLAAFVDTLQRITQCTIRLEKSLNCATAISEGLQTHLSQSLGSCDGTTAVLNKQIMRLQPETISTLNTSFLTAYKSTLDAHVDLFGFFVRQLSRSQRAEQDSALESTEGQQILVQAQLTAHEAQTKEIFQDDTPIQTQASSSKGPFPGSDDPPPYETSPTDANRPSCSQGECSGSSSGFAKGFSSLTNSFKALAANFKAKPDPLVNALCQAALRGDVQQMKGLIGQGAKIDGRNDEGNTPLTCTILANQEDAAKFLLAAGVDYSTFGWSEMPPLFLAASVGSVGIAQLILDQKGKINPKSWVGQPYFGDVVTRGNLEGARWLLENGANPSAFTTKGSPVIVNPIKNRNIDMVNLLIKHGANTSANDGTGNCLLALAANLGFWDITKILLDNGAKPDGYTRTGMNLLADSITKRRVDFAKELLLRGADPNSRDLKAQKVLITVLLDAQLQEVDKHELVRHLLLRGASPDASDTKHNQPAICHAMDLGNNDIINLLLQHGAKTKKNMRSGETLLLYAIDHDRPHQAYKLLEHGADPNAADAKGRTPLMTAIMRRQMDLVQELKRRGADVNLGGKISAAELEKFMSEEAENRQFGPGFGSGATSTPGPGSSTNEPPAYDTVMSEGGKS